MDKIKIGSDLSTRLRTEPTDDVQKEAATHIDLLEQWIKEASEAIDRLAALIEVQEKIIDTQEKPDGR